MSPPFVARFAHCGEITGKPPIEAGYLLWLSKDILRKGGRERGNLIAQRAAEFASTARRLRWHEGLRRRAELRECADG